MDITQGFFPAETFTAAAAWLNSTFETFDYKVLEFYASIHASSAGKILDVLVEFFSRFAGDGGILLIIISVFLMLFKKTRKLGAGMLGGLAIGVLFTNFAIKNIVARPRPYCTTQEFWNWWQAVGHGTESDFSFPSGHTTAAMAAMTPVFCFCNKKKSWAAFLFVIALGASRNYLMVHFPSDILGGIIVGGIAGLLSFIIVYALYDKFCETGKLGNIVKTFDIKEILTKKKAK